MIDPDALSETAEHPLTVIIADDESAARARLRRLLSDEPGIQIVSECANGKDALMAILEHSPDLVFLDIQMPELTGFEVLEGLGDDAVPLFVFVTAYSDHALTAFAVDALDYLLKPFDAERLRVSVRRARERKFAGGDQKRLLAAIQEMSETQREIRAAVATRPGLTPEGNRSEYLERLAVKTDGRVFFVRTTDVDYVESAGNYVRLHVGDNVHVLRERLSDLAARLNPSSFARIHRGTIVNLDKVKEIQPWFSGDALVILHGGQKLRLSRSFRSTLTLGTRSRL